jgi:hypothetical protein
MTMGNLEPTTDNEKSVEQLVGRFSVVSCRLSVVGFALAGGALVAW